MSALSNFGSEENRAEDAELAWIMAPRMSRVVVPPMRVWRDSVWRTREEPRRLVTRGGKTGPVCLRQRMLEGSAKAQDDQPVYYRHSAPSLSFGTSIFRD